MNAALPTPETLLEVIRYFEDERVAWSYFVSRRWPKGVVCPHCSESGKIHLIESRLRFRCNDCGEQFSAKTGTVFEASHIPFSKWLPAMWLITNAKNGISSYELHRGLGVTQKTAWFMLHRIRLALQNGSFEKLADAVEVDETYIGGKARNMHKEVKERKITGTGGKDKAVVFGMLERGGNVKLQHIERPTKKQLHKIIKENVLHGCNLYSDALRSYDGLDQTFQHGVIDHATSYVEGQIHTNGLENFWSLLKRTINGTYVSIEPFHLFRYLDEQAFRYNERKGTDADRFELAVAGAKGKRVTYAALTGNVSQQQPA
ncbi:MAG TPA: IS1595 family transposase [Fimbriimonas sp.]|nr:IS1595 family transposase [Fimbriimonas sp.]